VICQSLEGLETLCLFVARECSPLSSIEEEEGEKKEGKGGRGEFAEMCAC
jgi:hypothetical protein